MITFITGNMDEQADLYTSSLIGTIFDSSPHNK